MNEQEEEAFWFWILITEIAFLLEYLGVFGGQEYITHIFVYCQGYVQSLSLGRFYYFWSNRFVYKNRNYGPRSQFVCV